MPSKADQLIEAATELFDERGYHATGIDAILERAGVAKMTLYKHFGSKDDLILAALRRAGERGRAEMFAALERVATTPRERMLAVFDFAERWVTSGSFHGCVFIRASGEFTDGSGPVRDACREHGELITRYLAGLAVQAGAADPGSLASQLVILFQGVLTAAQSGVCPGADPATVRAMIDSARSAASTLVDASLAGSPGAAEAHHRSSLPPTLGYAIHPTRQQ